MGPITMLDALTATLSDPRDGYHMGITAENIAEQHGISRADQDAVALESQRRAATAIAEGRFKDQIVAVEIKGRKGSTFFDTDEHVRGETQRGGARRPAPPLQEGRQRDGG